MAEIIDINVSEVVENIQITTTENLTTVNINKVTGSGASWGEIEGTLNNQTDLQEALDIKANVSELGATAFSNDYNDLYNKPTIPTLTSELTNDSGFITIDDVPTPDLSQLVPYTGATQDVNLGNNNLNAKGVKINGTALFAGSDGELYYKNDGNTLAQIASRAWVNAQNYITNVITALGYTPENSANKSTSVTTDSTSNTKYPSVKAVFDWANSVFTTSSAVASQITTALVGYATQSFVNTGLATKQDKFFSHKLTTPTAYVTGTVSETEVYRLTIPANTLSASDAIKIPLMLVKKLGTNGTVIVRGKMSTSPTMPTGTTDLIFQTPVAIAGSQTLGIIKTFFIDNGNIKGTQFNGTSYTDNGAGAGAISEKPFDIMVTNYLYLSVINGSASDQTRLDAFQLTNS